MKQSSTPMSSLAAKVLKRRPILDDASPLVSAGLYNRLLRDAKKLAGSVLSQDETQGEVS